MIYFTADNHFFHGSIIGSCNRPFSDVSEMNKEMIKKWNNIVTNNDDIYILGDFAYKAKTQDVNEILSRLKGRKYLIKGNHEHYLSDSNFNKEAFVWVKDYYVLNYKGTDLILFHYPILEWHKYYRGSIHLYGHVHNSIERNEEFAKKVESLGQNAINVGVDVNYFCPISILRILEQVKENKETEDNE